MPVPLGYVANEFSGRRRSNCGYPKRKPQHADWNRVDENACTEVQGPRTLTVRQSRQCDEELACAGLATPDEILAGFIDRHIRWCLKDHVNTLSARNFGCQGRESTAGSLGVNQL